jgi:hypothetical protein
MLAHVATLTDSYEFLVWSFSAQVISGLGVGMNSVSIWALVIEISEKEDREKNIG